MDSTLTKILFTDLDGTLLTSSKDISSNDLKSIAKLVSAGHKFVVATGRPFHSAYNLCKEFDFIRPGFYIAASNGGVIYDCSTNKFLVKNTVPYEHVEYIFKEAARANLHVQTYTDSHVVALRETNEIIKYTTTIKMPYKILNSIPSELTEEPPKVIVISHDGRKVLEPFRDSIAPKLKGKLNIVFSANTLLEFLPLTTSKGLAIKQLCDIQNIPIANSIACGDEENDISMIEAAGIGVAMKNGNDYVKSHANYVTNCTNDEDGITEVIEKFILS